MADFPEEPAAAREPQPLSPYRVLSTGVLPTTVDDESHQTKDPEPLRTQLFKLRAKALQRASQAVMAMQAGPLAVVLGGLFLLALPLVHDKQAQWTGTLDIPPWLLLGTGLVWLVLLCRAGLTSLRAGTMFSAHYRLQVQRLRDEGDALLIADEERLRVLQNSLGSPAWGGAPSPPTFATLGERLEFAAFHLPSLRLLAQQADPPSAAELRRAEQARRCLGRFDPPPPYLGWRLQSSEDHQLFGLSVLAQSYGAPVIQGCARLVALIDFQLDRLES